jgi:hypothetical protein
MHGILIPAAGNLSTAPVGVLVVLGLVVVLEIGLDVVALVDLYRRPRQRVVGENKWIWLAIILLANLIGPVIYLAVGRKPAVRDEPAPPDSTHDRTQDIVDSLYGPNDGAGRS